MVLFLFFLFEVVKGIKIWLQGSNLTAGVKIIVRLKIPDIVMTIKVE